MLKEGTFNADGVTINYAEGPPSGPPLVLLHGGGDRWQSFLPVIPGLVMRWHIYALDLRGHGKSGRVPGQYRPEHYVADVVAFLERQLAECVILFGHSLGGWIALMAAAECPEKVQALILGDPPLSIERYLAIEGSEGRKRMWSALRGLVASGLSVPEMAFKLGDLPVTVRGKDTPMRFQDLPGMDTVHLRNWAKSLSHSDADALEYHAEGRLGEYVKKVDLDGALRKLTFPTLLLQGDPSQGGVVSDSDVENALSLLADGLHVQLEGVGHGLGLSSWNADSLIRAVMDFLGSL